MPENEPCNCGLTDTCQFPLREGYDCKIYAYKRLKLELDALRASTDAFRQRHPIPKSVPITTADDPRIELLRRWVTPNYLGETAANSLVALI